MGHALNGSIQDVPRPLAPDARLRHALAAGLRPRRHRDAERRRESSSIGGGHRRARTSGARRSSSARGTGSRRPGRTIMGQFRRLGCVARLLARAVHDGRRLRPRGDDVLRPAVGSRVDLPREPDRELVPVPPDRDLRPRGRARGDGRHAVLRSRYPFADGTARGRLDRDGSAGDDPRRRRRRRAPGRPALCATRSAARSSFRTSSGACR